LSFSGAQGSKMPKQSSSEEKIYRFVCENPGNCTYTISKRLRMSGGKVRNTLSRLKQRGLVKFKFERRSPRIKKLTYPVKMWDLLPRIFKKEIVRLKIK